MSKVKKKYPIPTKIKVGAKWYTVDKPEVIAGCKGTCDYSKRIISIASRSAGYAYTSLEQFETLYHELTHAILHDMGSKLEGDEKFVTDFSKRLVDAIVSAKFQE